MKTQTFILQHLEDRHVCEYAIEIVPTLRDSTLSVQVKAVDLAVKRVKEAQLARVGGYPRLVQLHDDLSITGLCGPCTLLLRASKE